MTRDLYVIVMSNPLQDGWCRFEFFVVVLSVSGTVADFALAKDVIIAQVQGSSPNTDQHAAGG